MRIDLWIQRHQRSLLFLILLLVISGIYNSIKLPVALFPNIDFPRVEISVSSGDMTAEQMIFQVTKPVEEAIRLVPHVRDVRSKTTRGEAQVSVYFPWKTDMANATLETNAAISRIMSTLPKGTTMLVRRMDTTVFPIISYSLTSNSETLTKLREVAEYQLKPLLSSVEGVSRIQITGGTQEEFHVTIKPAKLLAYGLTINDVMNAINANNVITAVGKIEDHYKLYLTVTDNRLSDINKIKHTIIRSGKNGFITVDEVANVTDSTVPQWIRVNADGKDAVLINIFQQPDANTVSIEQDIRQKLDTFKFQGHIKLANWYDQSQLVIDSAVSVRDAILIGVVLAAGVLFLFLRNYKITLIAIVVVPAVLASTVTILAIFGMTFNIMTLGGMAAAVGLIIDDAIVMIEHIMRRLRDHSGNHSATIMQAAREFTLPLVGSSSATVIIFIPLTFLDGVTGAFFKALSLTMAASLVISFLITWLVIPLISNFLLTTEDAQAEQQHDGFSVVYQKYEYWLTRFLRQPLQLAVFLVPLFVLGGIGYYATGSGFMPETDEGGFTIDIRTEPGTSLTESVRLGNQVEAIIKDNPNVLTFSHRTGTQMGGWITESYQGDFFVRLKSGSRDPINQVMETLRQHITQKVPGVTVEFAQLMEDRIGDLTSVPQPVEIKIFDNNQESLLQTAVEVSQLIKSVPGIVDIKNGINPAGDALQINIDPVKAAFEKMDPLSVNQILSDYMTGVVVTSVQTELKMVGIRVWLPQNLRSNEYLLKQLLIKSQDGHIFPLSRIATIKVLSGQPQIQRENFKQMVAVTARINGRDLGSVMQDVQKKLVQSNLFSKGSYYELGGLYQQQQIAFHGLLIVFISALALVFLLLVFLYENFKIALSILLMPIAAIPAIFIGLWVTHVEFNISAMMGMTMIVGIITEVAILFFTEFQSLTISDDVEVLIQSGKNRMRPIVMTTMAAIITLLPLALAIGQGAAMQQPLAIAIVSGLIVQIPLVLFVMPVIYYKLSNQSWRFIKFKK
ncbi:MAG: transporter [Ferrovum sp. 37-45-19]|uniref:efflux RND transporter permease subunit n=1 Tax=Ferrovum sp. JA12 TaxID=1356299 RepID=UPI00070351B0|nr:efflux RND transporter permease subunit [Ferrovum sp. JA12]KRH79865.1 cobalt-zinc-cadmium resistance protein CzcA [Ferrovum sp. JA12]OYV95264.1 MAG: transporter [Ferrovum sp. 37-45-19]OZB33716.1 MAG: transporter [Ferrovum sp. 34-44-207]